MATCKSHSSGVHNVLLHPNPPGLNSAALAIIQISLYLGSRNTKYFMTPACMLPKAYSNSLMVLLNNRSSMRQTAECITIPQIEPHSTTPQTRRPIQVNIDQETFTDGEHSSTTTVDSTVASHKASG